MSKRDKRVGEVRGFFLFIALSSFGIYLCRSFRCVGLSLFIVFSMHLHGADY